MRIDGARLLNWAMGTILVIFSAALTAVVCRMAYDFWKGAL